ncbi:MAG: MATE family efflux transporter, partial [Kitasatospora sp.]|nr:MATE family efflux transporter [Kitasatospora sp.]
MSAAGPPATRPPAAERRRHDREILALALPAFGALVAEPLFLMADSAIVGHLGTAQLAGLGVASAALTTVVGVFAFLAYATTAAVARRIGAGDRRAAVQQGIDGIWLALLISVVVVAAAV